MGANNNATRKALTALVNYLNKEVKRTSKCKRCRYRGKSFRGEPCYWHVDCGIDASDDKASDNAMYLLKRFKLQEALSAPPRNCDVGTAEEQFERWQAFCGRYDPDCKGCPCDGPECSFAFCGVAWAQMPYNEGGAK